jgi:glycosyltransferase involved in cell wall biosynthesis
MSPEARMEVIPQTTLIICSRGRPQLLRDAVSQVLSGTRIPEEFIVLEQAEHENAVLADVRIPECRFHYVRTDLERLSDKRNHALSLATKEIVAFVDDDVLVTDNWFATLIAALLASPPRTVVTGRVLAGEPEAEGAFAPSLHKGDTAAHYVKRSTYEDPLAIFNVAFPRSAWLEVGGFDCRMGPGTRFPSCEDNDFAFRLLEASFDIVFEPAALVHHRSWRGPDEYFALRYRYGRGQGAFYAKHLSVSDAFPARKMVAAWRRHAKRMIGTEAREAVGEAAWFLGFGFGLVEWAARHRVAPVLGVAFR